MRELAVYTQVDPAERINRYTNFMKRLQSTPKVNIYLLKYTFLIITKFLLF